MRILATTAAVLGLLLGSAPALAGGPGPALPSTETLTKREAHRTATQVIRDFAVYLPSPTRSSVGECRGGPYVWTCEAIATSEDVTCRSRVAVWADARNYHYEMRRLRCG